MGKGRWLALQATGKGGWAAGAVGKLIPPIPGEPIARLKLEGWEGPWEKKGSCHTAWPFFSQQLFLFQLGFPAV